MYLRSWHVLSLPIVECYQPRSFDLSSPLRHLGTVVRPEPLDDGRRTGDTTWGADFHGQLMAVSWDWVEILPGVVCMVDPGNVLTNIRFLDSQDCYEEPSQAIVSVNILVYRTPWQSTVCAALDGAVVAPSCPSVIGRRTYATDDRLRRAA